ncbi:MAG: hypothetical protein U1E87_09925 [Alphaproteobacteria bacterium]
MTIAEFLAWFAGFSENIRSSRSVSSGRRSSAAQVARIEGSAAQGVVRGLHGKDERPAFHR